MNLKHPTTSLLDAALLDQTWIEAGNYSFDHFPDLNYNVSFSSSFQRIQFQLFKGLVVVAADTFYLSQDGLLDFLKSLNLSFLNGSPENRGVFKARVYILYAESDSFLNVYFQNPYFFLDFVRVFAGVQTLKAIKYT